MKSFLKITFLFLVSYSTCFSTYGQAKRLAPRAGLAISHIDNQVGNGFVIKGRSGFTIGSDWRIEKNKFYLQPGLFLQHINTRLSDPTPADPNEFESRITSLKVPLSVGWYVFGRRRLIVLHTKTGLVPELVLGSKAVDELGYSKDLLNNFQINGMFGLGVDIAIFTINLSHQVGFSSMLKDNNLYSRTTILTFGLIF